MKPSSKTPASKSTAPDVLPETMTEDTRNDLPAPGEGSSSEDAPINPALVTQHNEADEYLEAQMEDEEPGSFAGPEKVLMGNVSGVLSRIRLKTVQGVVGEEVTNRAAAMQGGAAVSTLKSQMQATDGRCAPMIFTGQDGKPEHLFAGIETLAAAMALGDKSVFVVVIAPEDTERTQSLLIQRKLHIVDSAADEKLWKAQIFHGDRWEPASPA